MSPNPASGPEPLAVPLDERSKHLRRMALGSMMSAGRGHLGPAMSLIEILRVLYDDVLTFKADEPQWGDRDRCILSKGHGCLALYAILADKGFFPKSELDNFCGFNGLLGGHPEIIAPGVEASTGALGHGLSIGVGMALANRMKKRDSKVVVVMGDGEINEGSVWEAAMAAAKHGLNNVTAIVDYNKIQSYGPVNGVQPLEPLMDKWESFGFAVEEVNGHDVEALRDVLGRLPFAEDRPSAVICHTVKGKGIPPAENNPGWHHKNKLKDEELVPIREALGEG